MKNHLKANSRDVQSIIRNHYLWLKKFWTPTKETYFVHGQFIAESELRKVYEVHHPQLPKLIAEGYSCIL